MRANGRRTRGAVGRVQLVCDLIVNLNVVVLEAVSGGIVAAAFLDLRDNTDRSWRHATEYLPGNILVDCLAARS